MKCYIIIYELNPRYSYVNLFNAIQSYPHWGKLTNDSWAVLSYQGAEEIRNHLRQFMDANDKIMIIKSGAEAAWQNTLAENEWLRNNLVIV